MKVLKYIVLYGGAGLVLLILVGITFTIGWRPFIGPRVRPLTDRKFEATAARMERGRYLVNGVAKCFFCHSEHDTSVPGSPPKPGTEGVGMFIFRDPSLGEIYSRNITPDKETGIGNWTDDQIARAIREGIDNEGHALFPSMPYENFRKMSEEDLASIVVYIRSIPAVRRTLPKSKINFPINRLVMGVPEPLNAPVANPDVSTPKLRGEYLVGIGACRECHTLRDPVSGYRKNLEFAGGLVMDGSDGKTKVAAANLTSDASGIPYYDEATFIKTIRNGQIGARKIDAVMPWGYFRNMSDDDLKALFAFIHDLAPMQHLVDNSVAPTMCPLCGNRHGLGEKNHK